MTTQDLAPWGAGAAPDAIPGAIGDALDAPLLSNAPALTVSELSSALKRTVEDSYAYVRVRGEVSRPKSPGSGHLYLTLKDDKAVLDAVCWRGTVARLAVRPEDGMEVICTGRLTTYAGQSKYQLVIEQMELAGEGALLKMLEERRRRLAAEGLFDEARKKKLPFLPELIGVVTSPTGAVIRDILHRLADRFPRRVLLWPVPVQGEGAAERIAEAIAGFNRLDSGLPRPDLLIVARGGGSLEDLMAFNDERVVRAAAASRIPLISAVGHETDTTLIDYAADRRAPTPTAAAEMAVPVRAELAALMLDRQGRLAAAMVRDSRDRRLRVEGLGRGLGDPTRLLEGAMQRLDDRAERLGRCLAVLADRRRGRVAEAAGCLRHPRQLIGDAGRHLDRAAERLDSAGRAAMRRQHERFAPAAARLAIGPVVRTLDDRRQRLGDWLERLTAGFQWRLDKARDRLEGADKLLESCSYKRVLRRGYVVVRDADDRVVDKAQTAADGQAVTLEFGDGTRQAVVGETTVKRRTAPKPKPELATEQRRLL